MSAILNNPAISDSSYARAWLKEFDCLGAYVTSKERFSEWFSFYHKARPAEPREHEQTSEDPAATTASSHGRQYIDMVADERRMARYREEMERWTNSLQVQSTEVINSLKAVLTYPGGWLDEVVLENEEEEGTTRPREIEYLRRYTVYLMKL